MTRREKYLILAGSLIGLTAAGVLFRAVRVLQPQTITANTEAPGASHEADAAEHGSHQHGAASPQASETGRTVQLTEEEQGSIGLQTTVVERRRLQRELLAPARVEEPETQLVNISARIAGRIDQLHVDFTGQSVRRGQPIAEIYSPEVFTSAEEYRLALENRKRLGGKAEADAVAGADDLIAASRRRLELWGLTPQQIENIATSNSPQIDLTIYSPVSGIVSERKVTRGQYVNAGDVLYSVTDLSSVWVKAELYEADLPEVRLGQGVEVTAESIPGRKVQGRVGFIEPVMNSQTRTAAARIQVENAGMRLLPGMFVQARFALAKSTPAPAVPRSAVVDTGKQKLVYVAKGNGVFEARGVQLGMVAGEFYPVVRGLNVGERVVTEGNFMLDSQTRLTGSMSGMFGGSKEFSQENNAAKPDEWKVSFRSDPESPTGGSQANFHVSLSDSAGKSAGGVEVKAIVFMPAMPTMGMAEMRESAALVWNGNEYTGDIKIPTPGTWTVTVEVRRAGQLLTTYRTSLNAN